MATGEGLGTALELLEISDPMLPEVRLVELPYDSVLDDDGIPGAEHSDPDDT